MLTNSVLRACVAGRQAGAAELAVADLPSGMDCRLVGPLHAETLGRVPLLFPGIGYSVRRNTISHLVLERFEGVVILAGARRRSHLA